MISRNDGTEARLYDLREDPGMYKDVAGKLPDVARRMFDDYVLEDAGGPLPRYWSRSGTRARKTTLLRGCAGLRMSCTYWERSRCHEDLHLGGHGGRD